MGDSNRVQIRSWTEATWGTGPTTEDMNEIRMTGENLTYDIANVVSSEMRNDRQATNIVQSGADAKESLNIELSFESYDDYLASALFGVWSSDLNISSSNIAASANEFTSSLVLFNNVVAGQWIKVDGFTIATNNGYFLVSAVNGSGTSVTVSPSPVTESIGNVITVVGATLSNGVTQKSFTIERYHSGLSPVVYFEYNGMIVNGFNLNIQANSVITGSFDFLGKVGSVSGSATSSGSIIDANTNNIINAVSNVANFLENNTAVDAALVQNVDIALTNNLRGRDAVGTLGNVGVGMGLCDITGSMTAYFLNDDLYEKYLAGTETSISFRTQDGDGNVYIWTMHRVKFETDPAGNAGSSNSDVMEPITFRALRHGVYDNTIQIDKFPITYNNSLLLETGDTLLTEMGYIFILE
jgi:hypothetical protein